MCHMRKDHILVLGNILSLYGKSSWQVIFAFIPVSSSLLSSMFFTLASTLPFTKQKAKIFHLEGEEKIEMVPGALEFSLWI